MGKIDWSKITREDVMKAIQIFVKDNPKYPEPRTTFLLFQGKKLPAKHIRGMAYKETYGTEISKNDYAGGMETVRFFLKLGFDMFYNGEILYGNLQQSASDERLPENSSYKISQNASLKEQNAISKKTADKKAEERIVVSSKGVIEQKNALQLILNRYFDCDIVCEKTYSWLKTPNEIKGEYKPIYDSLTQLQGDTSFARKDVVLRCDFVCESRKIIIEYDERQHFSQARYVTRNYGCGRVKIYRQKIIPRKTGMKSGHFMIVSGILNVLNMDIDWCVSCMDSLIGTVKMQSSK